MDPQQERELVERSRREPAAFTELFDYYYPKIINYTFRRTGDLEVAEDLTAETFLRAYHKLWQFRFRSLPFGSWVYRIANNLVNDYYRRGKKWQSLEDLTEQGLQIEDKINILQELSEQQEQARRFAEFQAVQRALQKIPPKYQEVIALRFFEQKKVSEVAQILGKKEGTVKSLLSRGLGLLRQQLDPQPKIGPGVVVTEETINQNL